MTDQQFQDVVDAIATVIDGVGVAAIVIGLLVAVALFAADRDYKLVRQRVGKAILLGLEFLVAADIIRTVAVDPSFRSVGVLAVIVAVRTFLSFTLDVEIEGRWPWQQKDDA